jgi:cytochrome P450
MTCLKGCVNSVGFQFGSGGRTCIGKNISLLEMSKLVPELLRHFDIKLSDPTEDWTLTTFWFVKQTNMFCRINRRSEGIDTGCDLSRGSI